MGQTLGNAAPRHHLMVPADSADPLVDLAEQVVLVEQAELSDQLDLLVSVGLLVPSDLAKRHFDSEKFASIFRQFVANFVDHFGVHPKENPLTCLLWCYPWVNHRDARV
jgi:hypothetical protein